MPALPFEVQLDLRVPATAPTHAVRKEEFDKALEGLYWNSVLAIAPENIAGSMSEDGKLLTGSANGILPSQDGVTLAVGDRVLLAFQTDKSENGIYEVVALGDTETPYMLKRAAEADLGTEFRPNKSVYIQPDGTRYGGQTWKQVTGSAITIGTTNIEFAQDLDTNKVLTYKGTFTADGSATEFPVQHDLGTKHVKVEIHGEDGNVCMFGYRVTDLNTIVITAGRVIEADTEFQVTVMGQPD